MFQGDSRELNYRLDDMIYLYFTSGSTGTPKGVVGKNESLSHFVRWEIDTFSVKDTFRFSQLSSVSFDAFLRNVFTPLCAGATVYIPPTPELIMDGAGLVAWLAQNQISFIHCVPTLFRLITSEILSTTHFANLKYIVMSGEHIDTHLLKKWYQQIGQRVQLVNCYGPTETTLIRTFHFIKPEDSGKSHVPGGIPINNTQIIILNSQFHLCPPGIVGEIFIRTPFSTLGYLNSPMPDGQRFIRNPLSKDHKDIIYRTGDLGRELPDGTLEVLGRIDRMTKIRGIRIEPAEIESNLIRYPGMKEVLVEPCVDSQGEDCLCAYFISSIKVESETKPFDPADIKQFLSRYSPAYMIPTYFIQIDSFPLTATGKIDRNALPEPVMISSQTHIPPESHIERQLAEIWSDVLHIDIGIIGIHDNFFHLGGHSLKAAMVASKICKFLEKRVPLVELFRCQTISSLAQYIENADQERYIALVPTETKTAYPLNLHSTRNSHTPSAPTLPY